VFKNYDPRAKILKNLYIYYKEQMGGELKNDNLF
jgi:citrate synthase